MTVEYGEQLQIINIKHKTMEKATTSFTLDKQIDPNAAYIVDFSKLASVNDLVLVLSAMGFTFAGGHPFIEQVKPFLDLDNPIYPGGQKPAPKQTEMKLPKLKQIK